MGFYLPQNTPIALCAGGASLLDNLDTVRRLQLEEGAEVIAVGNVGHTLMANNIKVNGHVLLDGDPSPNRFVSYPPGVLPPEPHPHREAEGAPLCLSE